MTRKISIIFIITIVIFIVFGLSFPVIFHNKLSLTEGGYCTKVGCICPEDTALYTEIPCNTCRSGKFYFFSFLINIGKRCSFEQIEICENSQSAGSKYSEKQCSVYFDSYVKYVPGLIKQFIIPTPVVKVRSKVQPARTELFKN